MSKCITEQVVLLKNNLTPGWAEERVTELRHQRSNHLAPKKKNCKNQSICEFYSEYLRDLGGKIINLGLVASSFLFSPFVISVSQEQDRAARKSFVFVLLPRVLLKEHLGISLLMLRWAPVGFRCLSLYNLPTGMFTCNRHFPFNSAIASPFPNPSLHPQGISKHF